MPKILAFAGSARTGSFNKMLVPIAARGAREAGAEVTELDLRELPMPLYDGDLEKDEGLPANARRFKALLTDHDGFLIACPEYNGGITPLLKNAIDWASRAEGGEPTRAYKGKVAAIMSASPGGLGGIRGLVQVRTILTNLGVLVLPGQLAVSKAGRAFEENGELADEKTRERVIGLGRAVADMLKRLQVS